MKRKGLLALTGVNETTFDLWNKRGLLPFSPGAGRWTDYTLDDALALRLMAKLGKMTDLRTASEIAAAAIDLRPHPFGWTADQDMFLCAAVLEYDGDSGPVRELSIWGGRAFEAVNGPAFLATGYRLNGWIVVNASQAAKEVWNEARELGIAGVADLPRPLPETLIGYPEWFKEAVAKRGFDEGGE
jgi:hypothetical protein